MEGKMQIMHRIGAALVLCFSSLSLLGQSGFGAIRIGGSTSVLPFPCTGVVFCEGVYRSSWVRVSFLNGIIGNIDVIYSGTTLNIDPNTLIPLTIKSSPITLAQAIKLHSLQANNKPPVFGLAKGEGEKTYGLTDISNEIVYTASGASATSTVDEVSYVSSDAPVLMDAASSKLADYGKSIIQAAVSSEPYADTNTMSSTADVPLSMQKAASRGEAAEGVKERSDTVIGSGKMVLALIDQVSTWYQVDKDHPNAIAKSDELRKMYPKFLASWRDIILYADANKTLLRAEDLETIPFDLNKDVESKMRQLKAMGFEE
jgi:hypothetical protein